MLIVNAKILTMAHEDIENGYVKVENGKIKELGKMSDITKIDDNAIDIGGRYLLPGFIDAHSHLAMSEDGVGDEGEDINECSEPITPQLKAIDGINALDRSIYEARQGGVTCAVVSPGSANPIAGQVCAFKTIGRDISKMIIAEPLAIKFAFGENPKRVHGENDHMPMSRMASMALIRETLTKAKRYMQDIDKAEDEDDEDNDMPEYDFKNESLLPLLRGKIKAHMHAHRASDVLSAIRIAKEFGLKYTIVHGTEGHLIADILAEEEASVICGPIIGTRSKPELSNMEVYNAAVLIENGIKTAICTDCPEVPAQLLAQSAAIVCADGMDEKSGLLAITLWAAQVAGLDDRIGSIEAGKDADMLVYSEHPMHTYKRPDMVFINGELVE